MQTPLNKRVIGRHVGQKRKGSRAEQSKVSAEWTGAASEEDREWNRLCNWSTQPVASIGYANDLPWQVAACLPQLPSLATVHLPLCMPGASSVPLPALATCWVAVRQKLKPNNDFQSKQQLGRQATLRRLQLERRFNAIRFGARREGIAQFAPRNYATNACGTRSSTSPSPSSSPLRLPLLLALPTL